MAGHIESPAFYWATLNSEWYRIVGLLGVLGALMVFAVARAIKIGEFRLLWLQIAGLALVIAHEFHVLRAVKRALQHDKDVPPTIWALNVFVESQLPTLALFLLLTSQLMTPYQVLVAPALMIYFLFIILSTLRLSPSITVLTGIMSALGYLFVTFYIEEKFQGSRAEMGAFQLRLYVVYAGMILTAGILAAIVAGQIRGYVSAALREAELQGKLDQVKHDLEIARSIQQGLFPAKPPGLKQFEVAGWNQPADQTGGDYFDWQELPDGRLAISLGDATGHGIGPALVSASCRAYARASFLVNGGQNGLLDRLNRLLAEDLSSNRFVTFAVVFLDPTSSNVRVLSAGHGPILWYSYATNKMVNLEAHGIPLGMIAGVEYSHGTEVSLASNDLLVLVTDGFYEWANPEGEEFGMKRLIDVICESRDYPSEEMIMRLRASVMKFCRGTKQQDDLTAVIIRRKADAVKKEADEAA